MDMTANVSMGKTLEHKAWRRAWSDGIMEIYMGVLFLNAAAWVAAGESGLAWGDSAVGPIIVLILALGFFQTAKAKITKPRIGHFKIERRRLSKKRLGLFLAVVVTAMLVVFTILAGSGAFPQGAPFELIIFGVLGLQFVVGFAIAAYALGVQRLYLYALLGAVGMLGAEVIVANQGLPHIWSVAGLLGLPALAMIPWGIVLLVRFLREHPMTGVA